MRSDGTASRAVTLSRQPDTAAPHAHHYPDRQRDPLGRAQGLLDRPPRCRSLASPWTTGHCAARLGIGARPTLNDPGNVHDTQFADENGGGRFTSESDQVSTRYFLFLGAGPGVFAELTPKGDAGTAGFFGCLGFLASRLLRFWPLAIEVLLKGHVVRHLHKHRLAAHPILSLRMLSVIASRKAIQRHRATLYHVTSRCGSP